MQTVKAKCVRVNDVIIMEEERWRVTYRAWYRGKNVFDVISLTRLGAYTRAVLRDADLVTLSTEG